MSGRRQSRMSGPEPVIRGTVLADGKALDRVREVVREIEREVERFRQFRMDTCAARHVRSKPEPQEGEIQADVQVCQSCAKWSRIGETFDCPFGWDES